MLLKGIKTKIKTVEDGFANLSKDIFLKYDAMIMIAKDTREDLNNIKNALDALCARFQVEYKKAQEESEKHEPRN